MGFGDFAISGKGIILPDKQFIISQDLAKDYDYTTTEIYQISKTLLPGSASPVYFEYLEAVFRDKKQLTYDKLPFYTKEMMDAYDMWGRCILATDGTGVGNAVFDLYCSIGLDPYKIVSTGGNNPNAITGRTRSGFSSSQFGDMFGAHVPKTDLVASLKMHLERGMIRNGTDQYAADSRKQLEHFKQFVTKSKRIQYENDSPEVHDDFVITASQACWIHDQMGTRVFGKPSRNVPEGKRSSYEFDPFKEDRETWRL